MLKRVVLFFALLVAGPAWTLTIQENFDRSGFRSYLINSTDRIGSGGLAKYIDITGVLSDGSTFYSHGSRGSFRITGPYSLIAHMSGGKNDWIISKSSGLELMSLNIYIRRRNAGFLPYSLAVSETSLAAHHGVLNVTFGHQLYGTNWRQIARFKPKNYWGSVHLDFSSLDAEKSGLSKDFRFKLPAIVATPLPNSAFLMIGSAAIFSLIINFKKTFRLTKAI